MNLQKRNFTNIFLIEFTKLLIENSNKNRIIEINQRKRVYPPKEIQDIQKIKNQKRLRRKNIKTNQNNKSGPAQQAPPRPVLTIPKPRLPPRFQDIMPIPTKINIDLGKLNPILQNPRTEAIECDGPDIPLRIAERTRRKIISKIILTKEEIDKIINTFSEKKKIPIIEGIYKVAAGNLILLAVVSEIVGSKFVIRKISQSAINRNQFMNIRK